MNCFPAWQACLLLLALSPSLAFADIVTLEDGRRLEGLVEETQTGDLRVTTALGAVIVPRKDVLRVEREVPAWKVLEERLDALQAGDLNAALEVAIYAIAHDMRRKTPSILQQGLVPGDVRGALRALEFCERNRVRRGVAALAAHGVGEADGRLVGGPVDAAALGQRSLALGLQAQARRLFLFALEKAPRLPEAERGLLALDFHKVAGRWIAPETYYPARGYQRFREAWRLPQEIAALRAADALAQATAAAETASARLKAAQREDARARSRRTRALTDRAHEAAALASARLDLSAREHDLERADARRRDARRSYDSWCACEPRSSPRRKVRVVGGARVVPYQPDATPVAAILEWRRRRAVLQCELREAEANLDRARQARDRLLSSVQRLTLRVGAAEAALADADADLVGAPGRVMAAQAALETAQIEAREAKRALAAAVRERDLALAAAAKARAKEERQVR